MLEGPFIFLGSKAIKMNLSRGHAARLMRLSATRWDKQDCSLISSFVFTL